MSTESRSNEQVDQNKKAIYRGTSSDAVYGFGLIGAWIYYISHATSLWFGVLGFFKGIVWPAMLVYELLKYLEM